MSGISWPIAAADRGQSVAGYIEATLLRALIAAGLIEIERRPADDDI